MATAPARSLDAYREEADRFIAALDEEYYLHYAGHKDAFELEPIYERFADLTTLEACSRLGAAAADAGRGETELWRFACEGYLGNLTRTEAEEIAGLEASLTARDNGAEIPYRMLRPTVSNEPDRARRSSLEAARAALAEEHLVPRHLALAEKRRDGTRALGAPTYRALYERFGFPLDGLAAQCRGLLDETEELYVAGFDQLLQRRVGVPLEEAQRHDVLRAFRATDWDAAFPAERMVPALEWTLGGLGIDLRGQENVELDIEPRPSKSPRAFCAPIEVPGRVVLVIQPMGGPDDWHAFFHEAGHTEHFAHVSPDLPVEFRRLGDNSVTEGWAMLVEHLVDDPAWLSRRLDFARPDDFASEAAVGLLYSVRRYAGKFLYELELHDDVEPESMRPRYVEWLHEATKVEPTPADYLADVDEGFYSTCYLRAWALHAQLESFLREELGRAWFTRKEAGSLLKELWSEGQRLTAAELLAEVAGAELELAAVGERLREEVSA
ncbi:MAG TPA: hypothetical protein VFN93_09225 [Gaiellaceae bacterium]|nr:hypothetical protein [Gaiellaceae bacterium]